MEAVSFFLGEAGVGEGGRGTGAWSKEKWEGAGKGS